jgi:hypothetical protein
MTSLAPDKATGSSLDGQCYQPVINNALNRVGGNPGAQGEFVQRAPEHAQPDQIRRNSTPVPADVSGLAKRNELRAQWDTAQPPFNERGEAVSNRKNKEMLAVDAAQPGPRQHGSALAGAQEDGVMVKGTPGHGQSGQRVQRVVLDDDR